VAAVEPPDVTEVAPESEECCAGGCGRPSGEAIAGVSVGVPSVAPGVDDRVGPDAGPIGPMLLNSVAPCLEGPEVGTAADFGANAAPVIVALARVAATVAAETANGDELVFAAALVVSDRCGKRFDVTCWSCVGATGAFADLPRIPVPPPLESPPSRRSPAGLIVSASTTGATTSTSANLPMNMTVETALSFHSLAFLVPNAVNIYRQPTWFEEVKPRIAPQFRGLLLVG
jgi:hypothetical protein